MSWRGLLRGLLHGLFQPGRQAFLPAAARDTQRDLAILCATFLAIAGTLFLIHTRLPMVDLQAHQTPDKRPVRRGTAEQEPVAPVAKDQRGINNGKLGPTMKSPKRSELSIAPPALSEVASERPVDLRDPTERDVAQTPDTASSRSSQEDTNSPKTAALLTAFPTPPQVQATPPDLDPPSPGHRPPARGTSAPLISSDHTTTPSNPAPLSQTSQSPSQLMPPPPKPIPHLTSSLKTQRTSLNAPSSNNVSNRSTSLLSPNPRGLPSKPALPNSVRPSSSLSPGTSTLPTANGNAAKPRKKVVLSPGHSPLDWAHLTATTPSSKLRGVSTLQRITPSQLARHNGRKGMPAWSSFHGKVYNIGPYLDFHPGGKGELMRGAGKAGQNLFEEVHPWVNLEGMLGNCVVGVMVPESQSGESESELDKMD